MNDISTKFPVLAAGLQKASARFKAGENDDPELKHARAELQREWANLREHIRDELQSVRDFGIDVPGFDDDAPGDLIDLCNALGIDPHCRFDELLSEVRAWALRRRMEAQIDAAAVQTGDESATVEAPTQKINPGYLDLIVDGDAQTVGRLGTEAVVELPDLLFRLFCVIYEAGDRGPKKDAVKNAYKGELTALRSQIAKLRKCLAPLGVTVADRVWRLVEKNRNVNEN